MFADPKSPPTPRLAGLLEAARRVVKDNPSGAAQVLRGWVKQAGQPARSR
ncbi:hypothetical protein [Chitinimonas taiwanensis]|nr:hypothetical protein [Chitinimonas taiwanensis]